VRVIFVGLGVYALVAAIEGWCRGRLTVAVRMGLAFSSALLFYPSIISYGAGTLLVAVLYLRQRRKETGLSVVPTGH